MFPRAIFAAVIFTALAAAPACAADDADKGKVVLGLGAQPGTEFNLYQLKFRTRDGKHNDYITYGQHGFLVTDRRDFDDAGENGAVKILTMPAGDWEIYTISLLDIYNITFTPKAEFSIPFTVKAGETIYLGDFKAVGGPKNYTDDYHPTGAYFVVGDRSARDIPIAQKKDAKIGAVTVAIPDVAAAHTPFFVP